MHDHSYRQRSIQVVALLIMAASGGIACSTTHDSAVQSIIEPDALSIVITRDRPILLDVRSPDEYRIGHLAGALFVDASLWKEESLAAATGLDHEALWNDHIGKLGITGRKPVVIYDNGQMTEAARIWFICQHFGVPNVAVINGGYRALADAIAAGILQTSRKPAWPVPAKFMPDKNFNSIVALADKEHVFKAVQSGKAQIFDARTGGEFAGKDVRGNPRAGHLPTARNLSHTHLLNESGRLRSTAELARLFEEAGFKKDEPIIIHCQSGGRSSFAALAAKRAGYGPILNYYGSFGEWSKDATCPVE